MKAVVFGPGRIGCGFVGQLLRASGHEVVFAARNPDVVHNLNRTGHYLVRLHGGGYTEGIVVDGVRAVWTGNRDALADEIAECGLVTTSVGSGNLADISPLIAEGLSRRTEPVNVLCFENFGTGASYVRSQAEGCGPQGCHFIDHGFSPVLVSRVVSERLGDPTRDEPLAFIGDHPTESIVDSRRLVQPVPPVEGMRIVDDYDAWFQKKLFVFSAGHATAAYLGYLKGYHYIHSAVRDPEIRSAVFAAMLEGQQGLSGQYGVQVAGDEGYLQEIIGRFENASLNDSIDRVGRDPLRKLGKKDRLVGAAQLAQDAGINPEKLMLAAAAALYYCNQNELDCRPIRERLAAEGPGEVLREVSGLDPRSEPAIAAATIFSRLIAKDPQSPLLSLEEFFWA